METHTSVGAGYWAPSGLEHNSDLCREGDMKCAMHHILEGTLKLKTLILPDLDRQIYC